MSGINPSGSGDGIEPIPPNASTDWSIYPADSNVDLNNYDIQNGGTITASEFVGNIDLTGEDLSLNDLTVAGEVIGSEFKVSATDTYLNSDNINLNTVDASNSWIVKFTDAEMGIVPDTGTNGINIPSNSLNDFIQVDTKNKNLLIGDYNTSEVNVLQLKNLTGSRSNNCNPVSISFWNAVANSPFVYNGVQENAKILLRDLSGGDNNANAYLSFSVARELASDGDLIEALSMEGRSNNTPLIRGYGDAIFSGTCYFDNASIDLSGSLSDISDNLTGTFSDIFTLSPACQRTGSYVCDLTTTLTGYSGAGVNWNGDFSDSIQYGLTTSGNTLLEFASLTYGMVARGQTSDRVFSYRQTFTTTLTAGTTYKLRASITSGNNSLVLAPASNISLYCRYIG